MEKDKALYAKNLKLLEKDQLLKESDEHIDYIKKY